MNIKIIPQVSLGVNGKETTYGLIIDNKPIKVFYNKEDCEYFIYNLKRGYNGRSR